jgi:hypothetical protein
MPSHCLKASSYAAYVARIQHTLLPAEVKLACCLSVLQQCCQPYHISAAFFMFCTSWSADAYLPGACLGSNQAVLVDTCYCRRLLLLLLPRVLRLLLMLLHPLLMLWTAMQLMGQ